MPKYTKTELFQEIDHLKQQLRERERESKFELVIDLFVEYSYPWLVSLSWLSRLSKKQTKVVG